MLTSNVLARSNPRVAILWFSLRGKPFPAIYEALVQWASEAGMVNSPIHPLVQVFSSIQICNDSGIMQTLFALDLQIRDQQTMASD